MDKEIMKMAEQLKTLSNVAVLQYTNIVKAGCREDEAV